MINLDSISPFCPIHEDTRMLPSPGYEVDLMCVDCKEELSEMKAMSPEQMETILKNVKLSAPTPISIK